MASIAAFVFSVVLASACDVYDPQLLKRIDRVGPSDPSDGGAGESDAAPGPAPVGLDGSLPGPDRPVPMGPMDAGMGGDGSMVPDASLPPVTCDGGRDAASDGSCAGGDGDLCPGDPDKDAPGQCGCGTPDTDADGDGVADCNDGCPGDPDKVAPGGCGCGKSDAAGDSDGDGAFDCVDTCPLNALGDDAASGCGLGFTPANVDVATLSPQTADATTLIDCAVVLDTDGTPSFTGFCGGTPPPIAVQAQPSGPELVVVALRDLDIASSGSLRVIGSRPAVLVVFGDATIAGSVDVSAAGETAQAGGNYACTGAGAGGDVTSCVATADETGGGGGGAFGSAGGRGGDGDDCQGRPGGSLRGGPALVPLLGGCPGGAAGRCSGRGAGGGALQLSVAGTLSITGAVRANGGAGPASCNGSYYGGGGGGSGGALRLEAGSLVTTGATIEARGGRGGDATFNGGAGATSDTGPGADADNAVPEPQPNWFGGGGGGGGYGRIVLCDHGENTGCP